MFLDPLLLVRAANATFIAAAESSQILQCYDIRYCRTLPSIIFGCFSTVFLCTWTTLHLDIQETSLLNRVEWMMAALAAPELVFLSAFQDWTTSSDLLGKILKNYPECGWTEAHAQFVTMEGFRLVDANGKSFRDCVEEGIIDLPKVSKDEILGRSKGDPTAKMITVIQTAWFVFQCIHRRSQHLLLTQLEITTLAHTLINFFIYFFWWHKPYGVTLPIEVPFQERRRMAVGGNEKFQVSQAAETESPQPPPISNNDPSKKSEIGLAATNSSDDKSPAAAADKELESEDEATLSTPQHSWYTRLGIKTYSVRNQAPLSVFGRMVLSTIYFTVGGGFGAMQCLAWNSTFPTRAEQYIWQASSLIVTVLGGTTFAILIYVTHFSTDERPFEIIVMYILIPIYCLARASLIVLALLQLRALPYTGYATPSWSIFYPHIG